MTRPGVDPRRGVLAQRIAYVWAPALGAELATEAARAAVTPLGYVDATAEQLAAAALAHRVRRGRLRLDARGVAFLAGQVRILAEGGGWS